MYAVVVRESGQTEAIEGSEAHLAANVVPRVRQAPGAVSALWMTDGSGGTLNVLVFESEETARAALQPIRNAPRPGFITLNSAEVYRVLADF
jgi:hypothetical protein